MSLERSVAAGMGGAAPPWSLSSRRYSKSGTANLIGRQKPVSRSEPRSRLIKKEVLETSAFTTFNPGQPQA